MQKGGNNASQPFLAFHVLQLVVAPVCASSDLGLRVYGVLGIERASCLYGSGIRVLTVGLSRLRDQDYQG